MKCVFILALIFALVSVVIGQLPPPPPPSTTTKATTTTTTTKPITTTKAATTTTKTTTKGTTTTTKPTTTTTTTTTKGTTTTTKAATTTTTTTTTKATTTIITTTTKATTTVITTTTKATTTTTTTTTKSTTTTKATTATTTAAATTIVSTTTAGSSAFATRVKALVDANTCAAVSTSTICGNASRASSYYETFIYKTYRIVIISGVPGHNAEYSQVLPNPNTRCVRYQYFAAPASPTHSTYPVTPMGAIGFMTSGTTIYNPLSGPDGSLASYYEWNSLDPCYGHSSPDKQYHYHAVSGTCLPGSTTPSTRTLIGYALDGYPMYGYATTSAGVTLKSCWVSSSTTPSNINSFTYDSAGFTAGTCHLDKANGYTFSDGYGYVMVSTNYYVPYYFYGSKTASICGFTP